MKHRRDVEYAKANLKSVIFSFGALILVNLFRIIKVKEITDLRDLYKHVESLSLYEIGDKYKLQILGL